MINPILSFVNPTFNLLSPINQKEAYESLEKKTRIQLEHPLLTELHNILVKTGDYRATEDLVLKSLRDDHFSGWLSQQRLRPEWSPLILPDDVVSRKTRQIINKSKNNKTHF